LLGRSEFVDNAKNSVVPPSNEFASQVIVIPFYFLTMDAPLTPENAIFVVFGVVAAGRKARQSLTFCIESLRQGATLSLKKRVS
jgi:hypothetical protein